MRALVTVRAPRDGSSDPYRGDRDVHTRTSRTSFNAALSAASVASSMATKSGCTSSSLPGELAVAGYERASIACSSGVEGLGLCGLQAQPGAGWWP